MKHWSAASVPVHITPGDAVILARTTLCAGSRFNTFRGYWLRVWSRDETPLADAILAMRVTCGA